MLHLIVLKHEDGRAPLGTEDVPGRNEGRLIFIGVGDEISSGSVNR